MKPKIKTILEMAINEGVNYGWSRAHKHNDNPDEYVIKDTIETQIMEQIYEYFSFDEEY